jgi:site-specific recombinase XerD
MMASHISSLDVADIAAAIKPPMLEPQETAQEKGTLVTPNTLVSGSVDAYRAALKTEGKSAHTVDTFSADIRKLGEHFPNAKLCNISTQDLRDFLRYYTEKGYDQQTVYCKMCAFKNFFRWLVRDEVLTSNPAAPLVYNRKLPPLPKILSEDESARFIEASKTNPLEVVLTMLLLRAGLKRNDLVSLEPENIDISDPDFPTVEVNVNDRYRRRKLELPIEFPDFYKLYLEERKPDPAEKLFDYTEHGINNILKGIALRAGITNKPVSCQMLRDTFGVFQLGTGDRMKDVLKKLGLSPGNENAIDKYTKLADQNK